MGKNLPLLAEIRRRFRLLGYEVQRNVRDQIVGRKWAYATAPLNGGAWGHFASKADLVKYLEQVEQMRRWSEGEPCE